MNVTVNGKILSIDFETTKTLKERLFSNADITILNGFQTVEDIPLKDGDTINYIKKGTMPPLNELETMISSRHTPKVYNALKSVTVAIDTLDIVASYLIPIMARLGVGTILVPTNVTISQEIISKGDFIEKDLNLNYFDVLKEKISNINPFVKIEPLKDNYNILVTRFNEHNNVDRPTIYYNYGNDANDIITKELSNDRYFCGCKNTINDVTPTYSMVVSGHIANLIVNLTV